MARYIRKPISVEALQFTGHNCIACLAFLELPDSVVGNPELHTTDHPVVKIGDYEMTVLPSDWIIKLSRGRYHVCTDSEFQLQYSEDDLNLSRRVEGYSLEDISRILDGRLIEGKNPSHNFPATWWPLIADALRASLKKTNNTPQQESSKPITTRITIHDLRGYSPLAFKLGDDDVSLAHIAKEIDKTKSYYPDLVKSIIVCLPAKILERLQKTDGFAHLMHPVNDEQIRLRGCVYTCRGIPVYSDSVLVEQDRFLITPCIVNTRFLEAPNAQ